MSISGIIFHSALLGTVAKSAMASVNTASKYLGGTGRKGDGFESFPGQGLTDSFVIWMISSQCCCFPYSNLKTGMFYLLFILL